MNREHRVAGTIIGAVVGDALGAPFEFGPPRAFSTKFPSTARGVATEMCGGGSFNWAPGEFTDDSQMALIVGESLLRQGSFDGTDIFNGFKHWAAAHPPDVGIQTAAVLRSGLPWDKAAAQHFASGQRAAGNGSLMRASTSAVFFGRMGRPAAMEAGRLISALTHGDPAAGEGCAIFHEFIRRSLEGNDALASLPDIVNGVAPECRQKWAETLREHWHPSMATETNGAVWPTLGSAVWALRQARSFEEALRLVMDLGGDTDTVGAVTGALAGARYGIAGIPMRWASDLNGTVPGHDSKRWALQDLHHLAGQLDGRRGDRHAPAPSGGIEPLQVTPGIWASDLDGARTSDPALAVISLCRTGDRFPHQIQRFAYLVDDDLNSEIDFVLQDILADMTALRNDGLDILVHCYGGMSRTGLVLRAWLRRTEGLSADEATRRIQAAWPHLGLWNDSFSDALTRSETGRGLAMTDSENHGRIVFTPRCAVCGGPAARIEIETPEEISQSSPRVRERSTESKTPGVYKLRYEGPGGSGGFNIIDSERAERIAALFSGPPDGEALRKEFYDRAGFCPDCAVYYCARHWGASATGFGECPQGHGKSLDPPGSASTGTEAVLRSGRGLRTAKFPPPVSAGYELQNGQ